MLELACYFIVVNCLCDCVKPEHTSSYIGLTAQLMIEYSSKKLGTLKKGTIEYSYSYHINDTVTTVYILWIAICHF